MAQEHVDYSEYICPIFGMVLEYIEDNISSKITGVYLLRFLLVFDHGGETMFDHRSASTNAMHDQFERIMCTIPNYTSHELSITLYSGQTLCDLFFTR